MRLADQIAAATVRIAAHIRRTPVTRLDILGQPVELKLEQMQHTGSFKARGAFNTLPPKKPCAG